MRLPRLVLIRAIVGEILVIYGSNFGDGSATQVLFDYVAATIIYATPTQEHMGRKEAHQKTGPQTAPASQASENKTSIEVRTAGR